jgi:hypothetical protein
MRLFHNASSGDMPVSKMLGGEKPEQHRADVVDAG